MYDCLFPKVIKSGGKTAPKTVPKTAIGTRVPVTVLRSSLERNLSGKSAS